MISSLWIKTSERPPTKEDGDDDGNVFLLTDKGHADVQNWKFVERHQASGTPYWMSVPPLETKEESHL